MNSGVSIMIAIYTTALKCGRKGLPLDIEKAGSQYCLSHSR